MHQKAAPQAIGGGLKVRKSSQMTLADVPFVRRDPADVVGVLLDEVRIEIRQCPPHLVGVLLVHAKDDRLGEAVGLLQVVSEVLGDGLVRASSEMTRSKSLVWYSSSGIDPPVLVELPLSRPPACRVEACDDAVDAVGGEEAVVDALLEAVGVDAGSPK